MPLETCNCSDCGLTKLYIYLDIIRDLRNNIDAPIAAFQVSGEYAMLKAAAEKGWLDHDKIMIEQLFSFKRAGASIIASYFAEEAVKLI